MAITPLLNADGPEFAEIIGADHFTLQVAYRWRGARALIILPAVHYILPAADGAAIALP